MKKVLFFETKVFTGATRVTRTLAQKAKKDYLVAFAQVGNNVKEDIESAIESEKPDILFSSFIRINPEVIEAGKRRALYVIVRNDYNLNAVSEEIKERVRKTYPLADEIVSQTEGMKEELIKELGVDSSLIRVMDNPLNEEDILQKAAGPNPFIDNGCVHFLWVGRKESIKDLPTLEKAFEIVHNQHPNTDLSLVTDDPNPFRWMKYADCLVICSKSEASPNVLREALFLGTQVISTDCSETVRQLLPIENVVPVHHPNLLAEAMMRIVKEKVI